MEAFLNGSPLIQQIASMYHALGPALRTESKKVMSEDRSFF